MSIGHNIKTEEEITAKATEISRWAVIPMKALDKGYKPTPYENGTMQRHAQIFADGARWINGAQ